MKKPDEPHVKHVGGKAPEDSSRYRVTLPSGMHTLNWALDPHLWEFSKNPLVRPWDVLEARAKKNKPVKVKVDDIVGIGNHLAQLFKGNWRLRSEGEIHTDLLPNYYEARRIINEAQEKLRPFRLNQLRQIAPDKGKADAGLDAQAIIITVEEGPLRLFRMPDGTYYVLGGVKKTAIAKGHGGVETLMAYVAKLEDESEAWKETNEVLERVAAKKALKDANK